MTTKVRSEDTVLFFGLTPELTEISPFYKALNSFFEKKQKIDATDRFNFILFHQDGPNFFEDFTSNSEYIIEALESLESDMVGSDLVSGIIIAITLIIDIFKKYGGRSFRLIVFTDSGTINIPDHFLPVLEELIDMVKNLPFSIDLIGIGIKDAKESKIMKNIVQRSGGEFFQLIDINNLEEKLIGLAEKKEIGDLEALDKTAISKYEEERTFYASYENVALDPLPVKKSATCTICFQKDKDMVQCPICETIVHKSCWTTWAKKSDIGIPHVFRCHSCYNLIKLDKDYVLDVLYDIKPEIIKDVEPLDILSGGGEVVDEIIDEPQAKVKKAVKKKPSPPPPSVKTEHEQVKYYVKSFVDIKSQSNKRITRGNLIKGVKKALKFEENYTKWDDYIWAYAIGISKGNCLKITPKTIIFRE